MSKADTDFSLAYMHGYQDCKGKYRFKILSEIKRIEELLKKTYYADEISKAIFKCEIEVLREILKEE